MIRLTGATLRALLLAGMGGALAAACGGVGDESYAPGGRPIVNFDDLRNAPYCIRTCQPDYGSQSVDCNAEDGVEFFPGTAPDGSARAPLDVLAVGDLETSTAAEFYAYNDGTSDFLVAGPVPEPREDRLGDPWYVIDQSGFAPDATLVSDRCGEGLNGVLHLRGGPFREWGGGTGRRLLNFASGGGCPGTRGWQEGDPEFCPKRDERLESIAAELSDADAAGLRTNFYGMTADLSAWDGISFWARQGPDSQGGIRVYVGDRQLDEDIAFLEGRAGAQPLCGRVQECGCRNHAPCTESDLVEGVFFCWDPQRHPSPAALREDYIARGKNVDAPFDPEDYYELCGPSACNQEQPSFQTPDPLFATEDAVPAGTAQCLPYKLTNDLEDMFCYDPDGPPEYFPADGPQRCGDGWAKGVTLSTDWQFYKVPFTDLRQEGWGKEFQYLDLQHISLVRFTWPQGWIDVWLDDVRFYRNSAQSGTSE